ncbi:MAG: methyltransferase domain-containing protein [Chloroflexi bacterium]|nr:methyltransferase domain-containing protein [Chloroflexota bacterium]
MRPETCDRRPEICDYENSPWRTAFWPGREYEDRAERIALAHMLPPRGTRLCEIGAGFGRLAVFYAGYERVILIDYALSMLREARERLLRVSRIPHPASRFTFVAADLYNLPLADSALDTAVTVRVLHHVADIPRAFAEIARVVRPEGTYLTEFANKRHLKARLRYTLTHRGPDPNGPEPYEFVKLNFDFHPRYIADQLQAVNLIAQEQRAVSTFRIPVLKRIVPARILAALDGNLQSPISNLDLSPSIFVRAQSAKPGAPALNHALWRCVVCHSTDIAETGESLTCRACSRVYPIQDGIIDFK